MALEWVGINFSSRRLADELALTEDLEDLKVASPDFVKVGPHGLGVILGGRIATAEARLHDERDKLYGHATTTCMIFQEGSKERHVGESRR